MLFANENRHLQITQQAPDRLENVELPIRMLLAKGGQRFQQTGYGFSILIANHGQSENPVAEPLEAQAVDGIGIRQRGEAALKV